MAILLSDVSWGTYAGQPRNAFLSGTVSRSGNVVTISGMSLYFTLDVFGTGSATEPVYIVDADNNDAVLSTTTVTWNMGSGKKTSNTVALNNASVTLPATATSRHIALKAEGGDYAVFTINFSANATPPSGGFVSGFTYKPNRFENIEAGVTSIGTGGSMTRVRIAVASAPFGAGVPCRYEQIDYLSDTLSVTNESQAWNGGITITPNTRYYIGVYAYNGVLDYYYSSEGLAFTTVNKNTIDVGEVTTHGATFTFHIEADGNYKDKVLQYSLTDGASWSTFATVTSGDATTKTLSIASLEPNRTYKLRSRIQLGVDGVTVYNDDVYFSVPSEQQPFYCSVNGKTKKVMKLYCSVNGKTKEVTKLYGSVNGKTKRVF